MSEAKKLNAGPAKEKYHIFFRNRVSKCTLISNYRATVSGKFHNKSFMRPDSSQPNYFVGTSLNSDTIYTGETIMHYIDTNSSISEDNLC
jgi:hypothetical protein